MAENKIKVEKDVKESKEKVVAPKTDIKTDAPKEDIKAEKNVSEKKVESEPAVAKVEKKSKKEKKGEVKIELEREYIVPLKRGVLNVPRYRRAKKAIRVLKEFMVRHMQIRDRDLRKVKIDTYLNNELWFRGIKKPANKIKVKAKKIDGIVYVELADVPDFVKFAMARDEKRKVVAEKAKVETPKHIEKEAKSESEKTEEKEDIKSGAEADAKMEKAAVKSQKHTAQGKHAKKSMPVRKSLKK